MPDKAIKAYDQAIKANPKNAVLLARLAQLYDSHLHNPQQALEMAKEAHKLAPENPHIAHIAGRLAFKAADYEWASSLLLESGRKLPDDPDLSYDLAWVSYSTGGVAQSRAAMSKSSVAQDFGNTAHAHCLRAMTAAADSASLAMEAAAEAGKIVAANPGYVPALMVLALSREHNGDAQEASQLYERILARYPLFKPAARNLAVLYTLHLEDMKAYPLAVKAREYFPRDPEVSRTLGILAYRRGEYSRASQLLKESAAARVTDAELLYYLGMAHYSLKQPNETKSSLIGALALNLAPKLAEDARRVLANLK